LKRSQKGIKVFILAIVAVFAMSALVASSAAAEIVPAKFSSTKFKLTTTGLTVKRNGAEAKTCTFKSTTEGEGFETFYVYNNIELDTRFLCPSPTQLQMIWSGAVRYDTVASKYTFNIAPYTTQNMVYSPWGTYWQNYEVSGTWVNGSGSTASTVTFASQPFGTTTPGGQTLTLEGQLKVTTPSGGLVTLSH
jgi:hypothetical protein